jgi:exopolysaccharide production protein ExoQ
MPASSSVVFRGPLLSLLGKSPDLTNRLDIWNTVIGVASERPAFGWGWISYWAPWEPFFRDLVVIKGVRYLQAHDAWLDLYLQVGIVGIVVFGGLALATLVRSWAVALDLPGRIPKPGVPNRAALGFLPVLIVVALLVHSIAESRLLIEICFVLLVVFAIRTRGGLETRSVAAETTTA